MLDILEIFLRRRPAGDYLQKKYGFCSGRALAKLANTGGCPPFRKIGKIVVYEPSALDAWVLSKTSPPLSSTRT